MKWGNPRLESVEHFDELLRVCIVLVCISRNRVRIGLLLDIEHDVPVARLLDKLEKFFKKKTKIKKPL